MKKTPDQFIQQLYCQLNQVPLANFTQWALDLLQQVIDFDGAIWATGNVQSAQFHTRTCVDVDEKLLQALTDYLDINPIFEKLQKNLGQAIDMADVIPDQQFYSSPIYAQCFAPFGIERILSSIHLEQNSDIFTLLTLYRYDRDRPFSTREKRTQSRLLFHLLSAYSHRQLLELTDDQNEFSYALVDHQGVYHAVDQKFLALLPPHLATKQKFPFDLTFKDNHVQCIDSKVKLSFSREGELIKVGLRSIAPLDLLTEREQQIVAELSQGKTFKQVAKSLELSPSTVSNHLYRIYDKLNIHSRSELISLMKT
jgi:DNA-binding CsgD family transcriptional regulator